MEIILPRSLRGGSGNIIGYADNAGCLVDNLSGEFFEFNKGKSHRRQGSHIHTVPAAYLYLPDKIALSLAHAGNMVLMKNSHVLDRSTLIHGRLPCLDSR